MDANYLVVGAEVFLRSVGLVKIRQQFLLSIDNTLSPRIKQCGIGQKSVMLCGSGVNNNNNNRHLFFPVAVETLGALADDGHRFIREIGRRAALCTADPRETTFLYQRFSIAIQRFSSICLANSLAISESSG